MAIRLQRARGGWLPACPRPRWPPPVVWPISPTSTVPSCAAMAPPRSATRNRCRLAAKAQSGSIRPLPLLGWPPSSLPDMKHVDRSPVCPAGRPDVGLIFVAPSWWTAIPPPCSRAAATSPSASSYCRSPGRPANTWRPSRPATGERPSPSLWWGTSSTTSACRGHLAHRLAPGGHVYRHPAGGDGPGRQPPLWRTGRSPLPHPALPVPGADGAGLCLVNSAELTWHTEARTEQLLGLALAVGAVLCWTWYPLRNARWLREHQAAVRPSGPPPRGW